MPLCTGCHGQFEEVEGPTHAYMLAAPGCWAVFGRLMALEYSSYAHMALHRLSVDTYAVQHPGVNIPAARRSVGIHLSRLYLLLERGWPVEQANDAMLAINGFKEQCPWLEPPSMAGTLTVLDVLGATTQGEHDGRVLAWASSVWHAWAPHHAAVRAWCAGI